MGEDFTNIIDVKACIIELGDGKCIPCVKLVKDIPGEELQINIYEILCKTGEGEHAKYILEDNCLDSVITRIEKVLLMEHLGIPRIPRNLAVEHANEQKNCTVASWKDFKVRCSKVLSIIELD